MLAPKQVGEQLSLLKENGYITLERPVGRAPHYQLTKKGHKELDKPVYTVPLPRPYEPDEIATQILILITQPDFLPYPQEFATYLKIHIERVRLLLSELEQNGFISLKETYSFRRPPTYQLTDKGRRFIIYRDLI
jgi:predicted ArsR family transcriptional regulator